MSETDPNLVDEIEAQLSFLYVAYAVAAATIIYLSWRSTYVRDYNQLDLYRRRTLFILNPQTGVFERHPIVVQPQESTSSNATEQIDLDADNLNGAEDDNIVHLPAPPPTLESIIDEVNGLASVDNLLTNASPEILATFEADIVDVEEEAQAIIRDMDSGVHTQEGLRQRRLAFYQNLTGSSWGVGTLTNSSDAATAVPTVAPTIATPTTTSTVTSPTSPSTSTATSNNLAAPQIETVVRQSESQSRINEATLTTASADVIDSNVTKTAAIDATDAEVIYGDELTIKLKYLNDDLKIVKGRPSELIGDFKKRNFSVELAAHKLVRLVFNGHVLQPDTKTLTACGLFDNCVVHCLIHNPRPGTTTAHNHPTDNPPVQSINEDGTDQIGIENLINANRNRNRNTQRLLHLSLFLICLSVIISWFFRIQYFQLFTWYSTVGLVLLTTFFLVIIPLIFLIEREIFRNL